MTISQCGVNTTINEPLKYLAIKGISNNIKILSHVDDIQITGMNNRIDATGPNCLIQRIQISGMNNYINLNENCRNAQRYITGMGNSFDINSNSNNNNNFSQYSVNDFNGAMDALNYVGLNFNMNWNNAWNSNWNNQWNSPGNNNMTGNSNRNNNTDSRNFNMENMDNMANRDSNMSNNRENNMDNSMAYNARDVKNSINESVNIDNLSDFDKKKFELILEMDEYQYKHITKYESFKETECAICMADYKGNDIIKSFYKCNHIFHKKCLLDWLKKNNKCPICNHDLSDDIK